MTLGTRVAVMRDGTVQQVDTPQTLYREPVNLFVAAFIGSPSMSLVEATVDGDAVEFAGSRISLDPERRPSGAHDGRVILGIRPQDFAHGRTAAPVRPQSRSPRPWSRSGVGNPRALHHRRAGSRR